MSLSGVAPESTDFAISDLFTNSGRGKPRPLELLVTLAGRSALDSRGAATVDELSNVEHGV